jgi:hypothetical protein
MFKTLVPIFLLALNAPAQAYDVETDIARITILRFTDLIINDVPYDVRFTTGTYDQVFGVTPPTFLNNPAGAVAARDTLVSALNSLFPAFGTVDFKGTGFYIPDHVDTQFVQGTVGARFSNATTNWQRGRFVAPRENDVVCIEQQSPPNGRRWAVFSQIPEPTPLTLVCLVSLFMLRRR